MRQAVNLTLSRLSIGRPGDYHVLVSPTDKSNLIKSLGRDLGFDRVGVAPAGPMPRVPYLKAWLSAARAGEMHYLRRHHHIRNDPRNLIEGARSVIVTATNYHQEPPSPEDKRVRGRVAMYAWGEDYHIVAKRRLRTLVDRLRAALTEPFLARVCVDTVPILERELAAMAGVGWIGKNTMVLHQDLGSYFFLGEIVTTLELSHDQPVADRCGSCTRCLEACPTSALPDPYEMDASRCISYLTIEHRSEIPARLQPSMGAWIFGCDVCQEVCPYNRDAPETEDFPIRAPGPSPVLEDVIRWSQEDYRASVNGSAVNRATRTMLQRNARIAMRNQR